MGRLGWPDFVDRVPFGCGRMLDDSQVVVEVDREAIAKIIG